MMKISRHSFFTLLELLIVMMILSLGVIMTGFKVKQAYEQQRFLSESQQVLNQLILAQDLMLILNADVTVKISQAPSESFIKLEIFVEKPLSQVWTRLIEKPLKFSAIDSYEFKTTGTHYTDNPLILSFVFGQMSEGTLTLSRSKKRYSSDNDDNHFTIELAGYPSPLGKTHTVLTRDMYKREPKSLYPEEVYEKLYKDQKNQIKTP